MALIIAKSGTTLADLRRTLRTLDIRDSPIVGFLTHFRPPDPAGPKEHRIRGNGGQWDACAISDARSSPARAKIEN
jgi:hypothetical protein